MSSHSSFEICEPIAVAIAALLRPHGEVVLHDLSTDRIAGIWNSFSDRRVGDESLLSLDDGANLTSTLAPYGKTGVDGAILRSVSALIPGASPKDPPCAMLCINLDVTQLDRAQQFLASFVAPLGERPAALFAGDWREALNDAVHSWLADRSLSVAALTRGERIDLIASLDDRNLFEGRNAAEHAARLIGVSRATLYVYLNKARESKAQARGTT